MQTELATKRSMLVRRVIAIFEPTPIAAVQPFRKSKSSNCAATSINSSSRSKSCTASSTPS